MSDAFCTLGGDEGKSASDIIELRWIDPDRWGRYAWNFLFGTLVALTADLTKMQAWHSFIYTLPFALPCHSCKVCCARFLEASPPPSSGGAESRQGGCIRLRGPVPWPQVCATETKKIGGACPLPTSSISSAAGCATASSCGCTPTRCRAWLCRLRRDVRARNLAAGDTLTVANQMQGHFAGAQDESDEQMASKFTRRVAFPELWRLDAFVFLSTVILTAEYTSEAGIAHLREFLKGALVLTALPLGLESPSLDELRSSDSAMSWLKSAKFAPNPLVLQATLDVLPLRKRRVRRKMPISPL
jgi:hypothetical protein